MPYPEERKIHSRKFSGRTRRPSLVYCGTGCATSGVAACRTTKHATKVRPRDKMTFMAASVQGDTRAVGICSVQIWTVEEQEGKRRLKMYPEFACPMRPQANRNSLVLRSLIVSLSLAAFSNSNRLADSRMSASSLAI